MVRVWVRGGQPGGQQGDQSVEVWWEDELGEVWGCTTGRQACVTG